MNTVCKISHRLHEVLIQPDLMINEFKQDSALKRFQPFFDFFCKNLAKILEDQGLKKMAPRDALETACQLNIINNKTMWITLLNHRRKIYDEKAAKKIINDLQKYYPVLKNTCDRLVTLTANTNNKNN